MIKGNFAYSSFSWCLIIFVTVLNSTNLQSQFINVQIELEPELETVVLSKLNFGDIILNSGEKQINLGDPNMGIFSITAINSQIVRFNLDSPKTLKHLNPSIASTIGIELSAAYNNSGINNPENATPFNNENIFVKVNENALKDRFEWETVYVYIYGLIDVGNVPLGIYEGQIRLTIDYE